MATNTEQREIGLITYHSAYNFGSVLQALATQEAIRSLNHEVEVIDYRPTEGDRFYKTFYRTYQGPQAFLADLTMLPVSDLRKQRAQLYEGFIARYLNLTDREYKEPGDLCALANRYEIAVSGSDQTFNKRSNELARVGWEYMNPYLLTWHRRRKVSYASSPSDISDEGLRLISPELKKFNLLSCREEDGAERMHQVTGKDVPVVLDPTLLLDATQWNTLVPSACSPCIGCDYLLYYSLIRPRRAAHEMKALVRLSERMGLPVVVITPLAGYVPRDKHLINALASGPAEFLTLLRGAVGVVTESYHGTLFSVNYHKPVRVIEHGDGLDTRKTQVLKRLGLTSLIGKSIDDIWDFSQPDYSIADERLSGYRGQSLSYLAQALQA